ncbi:2-oxo acid dehydrogenase subunit E2 [Kitasatospora sp. NPDC059571]|uniref:2-oxo acid dehydrogenase subunit E2 n=1 Tax=Kitasatospora sp. NPDC059571 TaxID=3346871 RepID=UPI00367FFF03
MSAAPVRVPAADRARRHTRYFLEWARSAAPVQLAADLDLTAVQAHRAAARAAGTRYSVVSYLLYAAGRVLVRHPEANAAAVGRLVPRTVRYPGVHAKLALDRTTAEGRSVRTAVLADVDRLELADIQALVDRYRDGPAEALPGAAGVRLLGRLPAPLGRLAFRTALAGAARRPALLGTVAVSSLGHRRVDDFRSYGGTAVTLTAGRITDRPVVRDGALAVAPVLTLGLTFDHRVLDGARAADVLDDLAALLEDWKEPA